MSLIASAYLDKTFSERDEASLAFLSSLVCGTQAFDERHAIYGLPPPLFLFVEDLLWFAQAWRSGSWTYFEATPPERQQAMLEALRTTLRTAGRISTRPACAAGRRSNRFAPSMRG